MRLIDGKRSEEHPTEVARRSLLAAADAEDGRWAVLLPVNLRKHFRAAGHHPPTPLTT